MTTMKRLGIFWGIGAGMFLLRLGQRTHDFDPATGLYLGGAAGIALGALTVAALLLSFLFSLRDGKDCPHFSDHFAAPERSTAVLVIAAFLFMIGGMAVGRDSLSYALRIAPLATAALAILSGVSLLALTHRMRRDHACSLTTTLPLLFFGALWVLTVYLPAASDPIFERYYLPILATAVNAYAFAQFAGFFRQETRVRTFRCIASYAVTLSIASVAQLDAHSILFAACALLLSVLLALDGNSNNEKSE